MTGLDMDILLKQILGCLVVCPVGPASGDNISDAAQVQQFLREHGYPDAVVSVPFPGFPFTFDIVLTTRNGFSSNRWTTGPQSTLGQLLIGVSVFIGGPPVVGGIFTLDVLILPGYEADVHFWIDNVGGTCTTRHIICEGTMPIPALASVLAQPGVIRFRRPGAV